MVNAFEIIILGVVQGLTEFLPISSSGHLVLFQKILVSVPLVARDRGPILEIALHVGTLSAVLLYYRRDVVSAVRFLGRSSSSVEEGDRIRGLLLWIVVGSIPTALIGLLFRDWLKDCFGNAVLVGIALCATGVMCLITRLVPRGKVTGADLGVARSLLIGVAQGIAIIPGISRSGATIFTALCLGVEPREAGRYSFLLSVPAVSGAAALLFFETEGSLNVSPAALGVGIVASALVGMLCLKILTGVLRGGHFFYFGFYCVPLGAFMIIYFLFFA